MPLSNLYGWFPTNQPISNPAGNKWTIPENAPNALTDGNGSLSTLAANLGSTGVLGRGPVSQLAYQMAGSPAQRPGAGTPLQPALNTGMVSPDPLVSQGSAAVGGVLGNVNSAKSIYNTGNGFLGSSTSTQPTLLNQLGSKVGLTDGLASGWGSGAITDAALANAGITGSAAGAVGDIYAEQAALQAGTAGATGITGSAAGGAGSTGIFGGSSAVGALGSIAGAAAVVLAASPYLKKLDGNEKDLQIMKQWQTDTGAQLVPVARGLSVVKLPNGTVVTPKQAADYAQSYWDALVDGKPAQSYFDAVDAAQNMQGVNLNARMIAGTDTSAGNLYGQLKGRPGG